MVPSVFPDNSFKQHIYVIDQVWGQRGSVLAELRFFLGIFMDWDKVEVYQNAKKNDASLFILPTAAGSIIAIHFEVFKYIFKTNFM